VLLALAIAGLLFLPTPWSFLALSAAAAIEVGEVLFWRRFLRRYRIRTGPEALIGERAEVVAPCAPEGTVRFRGELWRARCGSPAAAGERVRIARVEGLTLEVEPWLEPE
jgi:membrane protein implicated in regulation of membrane protease activity